MITQFAPMTIGPLSAVRTVPNPIEVLAPIVTAPQITARKGGEPIVSLTSYHAHTAAIADPYVDFLLVGDSLGMVMHGFESTVPVPLDLMIMHGKAVVRGSKRALVVVDMPFGTYEESPPVAFRNAARIMKETDCGAIKLEGGARMAEDAGTALEQIESVSKDLATMIAGISEEAQTQSATATVISELMHEVQEVSEQAAESSNQAANSVEDLAELVMQLSDSVTDFKLPDEG